MTKTKKHLLDDYKQHQDAEGSAGTLPYESWLEDKLLYAMNELSAAKKNSYDSAILREEVLKEVSGKVGHLEVSRIKDSVLYKLRASTPDDTIDYPNPMLLYVQQEMFKQDKKWGEQNHPCTHPMLLYNISPPAEYQKICDNRFRQGIIGWADIALEELSEAIYETDIHKRQEEVIQLAAVCVQWAAKIQRDIVRRQTSDEVSWTE
jgi:hypothetical protein